MFTRRSWFTVFSFCGLLLVLAACAQTPPSAISSSGQEISAPTPSTEGVTETTSPGSGSEDKTKSFPKNADGYADISAQQLADMLPAKGFTLVNVHIPYDGELPQTDLFVPFDQVAGHQVEFPDKDAPIILYCRSGSMSTVAAKAMAELGYTNVLELDGGFNAWKAAGYKLLNR
jgi:rhodanese-related sulfurtransferase